jgi:ssDNA-binding Zn-finger/Zn-ribbon topoisomerase 1
MSSFGASTALRAMVRSRGAFTITIMRRNRRIDPKSFDLSTDCPECHYKVQPHELLRVDGERMRCPNCKQDVLIPTKRSPQSTAVPE